jgi:hypothetical protein
MNRRDEGDMLHKGFFVRHPNGAIHSRAQQIDGAENAMFSEGRLGE